MIDLRLPIGIFFLIVGGVLTIYGTFSARDVLNLTERINANLDWGIVLAVFGGLMTLLGWRAYRQDCGASSERR